uniref:fumonisin B1 esterase-like isoform X2 n=1 Tax=Myxine glutinosa TaxID=7769 RepID=UPI00358E5C44
MTEKFVADEEQQCLMSEGPEGDPNECLNPRSMILDSERGLSVRGCALIVVGLILICLVSATIAYLSGISAYTFTDLRVPCGSIRGLHTSMGYSFLGVPYAQYPARWTAPQYPVSWNDTYFATKQGPACPQLARPKTSEKCLFINVWSPTMSRDALLPVVVWFHGGSLMVGSGADPGARPWDSLAFETQTVYVSFNYRLGIFGFLALKELSEKSETGTSGNYGFLDQIAALKWVRDNIEHFGGDPKRVTLFGHEAGAISISALMLSPLAEGLFSAAIFTGSSFPAFTNLKEAEKQQASIFQNTSCDDLDCLQRLSTEKLLKAAPFGDLQEKYVGAAAKLMIPMDEKPMFLAVWDNFVLSSKTANVSIADIPIFIGNVEQDLGMRNQYHNLDTWTIEDLKKKVAEEMKDKRTEVIAQILRMYGASDMNANPGKVFATMVSDVRTSCPSNAFATTALKKHKSPVYRYVATQNWASQLHYVHPSDMWFGRKLREYLHHFISEGHLSKDVPTFPKATLLLSDNFEVAEAYNYARCNFWKEHGFF